MDERFNRLKGLPPAQEYKEALKIIEEIKIEASDRCNAALVAIQKTPSQIVRALKDSAAVNVKCDKGKPIILSTKAFEPVVQNMFHMSCHQLFFGEEPIALVPAKAVSILYILDELTSIRRQETIDSIMAIYENAKASGTLPPKPDVPEITYQRLREMADTMEVYHTRVFGENLPLAVRTRLNDIFNPKDKERPLLRASTFMYFSYRSSMPFDYFAVWDYMRYIDTIYYYSPYKVGIQLATDEIDTSKYRLITSSDPVLVALVRAFTLVSKEDQLKMIAVAFRNYGAQSAE